MLILLFIKNCYDWHATYPSFFELRLSLKDTDFKLHKMKILVTGASGFVGNFVCTELSRLNHNVVRTYRAQQDIPFGMKSVFINSLENDVNWSNALEAVDIVIHLAARVHVMHEFVIDPLAEFRKVNVKGTLLLAIQSAKAGIKRFIFISSVKVNGELTSLGKPFTENDPVNPQDAYALSKFEAEQGLLKIAQQTGMQVVIIRPPLVYGPGVKANFASMIRTLKRRLPLPFGKIYNKRSFLYIDNLVSLIVRCIDHPAAANQIFLISDGVDLSTTELLLECAGALGVKAKLLPIPQRWIEVGAKLVGRHNMVQRLCGNLQVDISKANDLLGWTPPVSVKEGLKITAQSLIKD